MRSKCLHEKGTGPCKGCVEAGKTEECVFPDRGEPDSDRKYRHPRLKSDKNTINAARREQAKTRRSVVAKDRVHVGPNLKAPNSSDDPWKTLPPIEDLIDSVNHFTRRYFQLGFIPKKQFPERLRQDHQQGRQVNVFLLLSILSISARLSPVLATRYGSPLLAAKYFTDRAAELAVGEVYKVPSLEKCQAFYLLSIAQQGSGLRNQSFMNMGIAIRMAVLMNLQNEETYRTTNPTPDMVIGLESARRTLWMLHSQDHLHSGPSCPVSLDVRDISALLPCDEDDFANGRLPASRAALEGTQPATEHPYLMSDPNRSLFASLMQIHHYWGIVGRRAVQIARCSKPWDPASEYARLTRKLDQWENRLPEQHKFSMPKLAKYKARCEDLAYLSVTMMTRLCNIVVRRPYLQNIIDLRMKGEDQHVIFADISDELFRNVAHLFVQIEAQFANRSLDESVGAQIAAFCIYVCGLHSAYLCKYPNRESPYAQLYVIVSEVISSTVCRDAAISNHGLHMLQRTIYILNLCKEVWPLAKRWAEGLEHMERNRQAITFSNPASMADSEEPVPGALTPLTTRKLPPYAGEASSSSGSTFIGGTESMASLSDRGTSSPIGHVNCLEHEQPQHQPHAVVTSRFPPLEASLYSPPGSLQQSPWEQPREPLHPFMSLTTDPCTLLPGDEGSMFDGSLNPTAQQPPAGFMTYDMNSSIPVYQQLGPQTDGFDGELQYYLNQSTSWMPPQRHDWVTDF
jgi:hypothetical protein